MRKYTLLIFYFIVSINPNTQMKAHPLAELIGQSVSSNTSNDSKKFLEADKTEAEVSISIGTKVTDRMIEYKEKVLPNIDGFAIQTNGKIITEKKSNSFYYY